MLLAPNVDIRGTSAASATPLSVLPLWVGSCPKMALQCQGHILDIAAHADPETKRFRLFVKSDSISLFNFLFLREEHEVDAR